MRKIIHVDMDCFYAAIEIRDNPALADKPVAVGGSASERSVLCTCNYIARKFGVRSAMATAYAERLCPGLIVLPVNMKKYREVAKTIHTIFREFTALVEPLSLDEAYLDVSDTTYCQGSATWIAQEIQKKIWDTVNLTASAGVAPNKFLAKIASGWKKPNGLFVIRPHEVADFVRDLPIKELFGVGKVTAEKLHHLGLSTCSDLQKIPLEKLLENLGKFGKQLYDQAHGIDNRPVEPNRVRKSVSVERTFTKDMQSIAECAEIIPQLHNMLLHRIAENTPNRQIKNQFVKIKFNDFKVSTVETISHEANLMLFKELLYKIPKKEGYSIRLLGLGVHLVNEEKKEISMQQDFWALS
jgi:DNA polymerase-4